MASIRTARVLAAVAALPLAAALFTGVAAADNGNSAITYQQAVGFGASNQSNTAQVNGSPFTTINQKNENVAVNFGNLW
ncbi:hypothetical protein AB0D78_14290 [Streptomyces avermitilis]|uniref:Secreted protein n=2 Tax=Streptomyces avermitilis TaxID=33903 RepID=Q82FN9_STRAW|nr:MULTISPECIES: hypothetical protein [Streptomyces]KUN52672.1 hypothetical protein AQJ43_21040 [Streptomyces avermitilis]MYS99802.1 hypothetical protein [Streptomyces sp. SID5469]OOV31970.1 hypothetical protein SM007_03480 [Streptomyces avermitilis]BAC71925.1 putative secreted protein [Streptomyces avermitilis MA-4680 = NBRC 14893]GDY84580.1 hypothetical protein SAVCW2_37790 [Streptomyces avermitilis]